MRLVLPGMFRDLPAVDDGRRPAHQDLENSILRRREAQLATVDRGDASGRIQVQVTDGEDRSVDTSRTALKRANAGQQLAEVEGLDEVVVGAAVEALNSVGGCVPRSEHQ